MNTKLDKPALLSHLNRVEQAAVVLFVLAALFWLLTGEPVGGPFHGGGLL